MITPTTKPPTASSSVCEPAVAMEVSTLVLPASETSCEPKARQMELRCGIAASPVRGRTRNPPMLTPSTGARFLYSSHRAPTSTTLSTTIAMRREAAAGFIG